MNMMARRKNSTEEVPRFGTKYIWKIFFFNVKRLELKSLDWFLLSDFFLFGQTNSVWVIQDFTGCYIIFIYLSTLKRKKMLQ